MSSEKYVSVKILSTPRKCPKCGGVWNDAGPKIKRITLVVCPICGKMMKSKYKGNVYCSRKCNGAAKRGAAYKRNEIIRAQVAVMRREGMRWLEISVMLDIGIDRLKGIWYRGEHDQSVATYRPQRRAAINRAPTEVLAP